jgi:hypothetical protein
MGAREDLGRLHAICSALPDVTERLSHGVPTWFAGKRAFAQFWLDGHHDLDFPHLWCAAGPGVQEGLVEANPERFFRPPYVGGRGWLGIRMDGAVDWDELAALCSDAYRHIAAVSAPRRHDARGR